jgi:hypothetical protein
MSAAGALVAIDFLPRYIAEIFGDFARSQSFYRACLPHLGREHAVHYYRLDRGNGDNLENAV